MTKITKSIQRTVVLASPNLLHTSVVVAGVLSLCSGSAFATAPLPYGNFVTNGGFEATPSLTDWTTVGGASVNVRASNDVINTARGNTGFSTTTSAGAAAGPGFFSSNFAVLGDNTGVIASGDAPNAGTFQLYQNFVLGTTFSGKNVSTYDLDIKFDAVFDGLDSVSTTNNDVFSAYVVDLLNPLVPYSLISKDSNGLRTTNITNAVASIPQFDLSGTYSVQGLVPGNYRLVFELKEIPNSTGATTNTAAGVDNVIGSGTVWVIPEPSSLPLLVIGLFGLFHMQRRIIK